MKIVFCGGGTAGHVMPNIALIEQLKGNDLYYLGCSEMDKKLLKSFIDKGEINYHEFEAVKFRRKLSFEMFSLPLKLHKSVKECRDILTKINPDVIFSKGGYAGLPVVIAGKKFGCRIYCHESDLSLGLANRISINYVTNIFTAFKATANKIGKKAVYSGIPLQKNIYIRNKAQGKKLMGFNNSRETVLVLGGSLGAARLNQAVMTALPLLNKEYNVFMITGKGKLTGIKNEFFRETEFSDAIGNLYEACDYIVSRAGSNTISEILTVKKPLILVPLSQATRGEQIENARYCKENGLALKLDEAEVTPQLLLDKINELKKIKAEMLDNQGRLANNATEIILKHILEKNV